MWSGRSAGRVLAVLAVAVGSAALVPVATAAQASPVRVETFTLPSPLVDTSAPGGILEKARPAPRIHVQLPEGYDDHPERSYPVLWLLHGANGGTDTWLPGITKLLAGLPAILVMPDGGKFGMYTDWWNGGARGGPAWATYHLEVLRQTIEDRYRIRPERRWHAIAGISMGGQGALRYGALLPGYFGTVVGFSAAMPNIQSLEVQGGIGLLGLAGATYGAGYEQIWGPAAGEYAEGNNPAALVPNYEHTRMYLTSGWGIHCPQDPINPAFIGLDTITEATLHGQQAPFAASRARRGGRRDLGDHLRLPHVRRLGPRHPGRPRVGLLRGRPRAPRPLDLPHHRHDRRGVGPPLPLRRAAVDGRRAHALGSRAHGDRQRSSPHQRSRRLPPRGRPSVRAPAPTRLPAGGLTELGRPAAC